MKIIGHRGACGYAPENTLHSFKKALEQHVDAIELDVYVLKTGELVVMHDNKVDRTTNGKGYIFDYSFQELRKLDAGGGQQVPTLQEVLDLVNKRVLVNIELKGFGTAQPVAQCIQTYVQAGWSFDDFMVSSFNHEELAAFHALLPKVKLGALVDGIIKGYAAFASDLNAYSLNASAEFISEPLVRDAKQRGLRVYVYTVNDEDETQRMQALGVDAIFTNYPDRTRRFANEQSAPTPDVALV